MKVSELSGATLDYWVAKAEGLQSAMLSADKMKCTITSGLEARNNYEPYRPSTDWSDGGPIIERERVEVIPWNEPVHVTEDWRARTFSSADDGMNPSMEWKGSTALIAAMRAYVASKFGEEVRKSQE